MGNGQYAIGNEQGQYAMGNRKIVSNMSVYNFRETKVYQKAFALAMEILEESKSFPKEETACKYINQDKYDML